MILVDVSFVEAVSVMRRCVLCGGCQCYEEMCPMWRLSMILGDVSYVEAVSVMRRCVLCGGCQCYEEMCPMWRLSVL